MQGRVWEARQPFTQMQLHLKENTLRARNSAGELKELFKSWCRDRERYVRMYINGSYDYCKRSLKLKYSTGNYRLYFALDNKCCMN